MCLAVHTTKKKQLLNIIIHKVPYNIILFYALPRVDGTKIRSYTESSNPLRSME